MDRKTKISIILLIPIALIIYVTFINWIEYQKINQDCHNECEYNNVSGNWERETVIMGENMDTNVFPERKQCISFCITNHFDEDEINSLFLNLFH